ncbi:MAG: hypothetical protein ACAI37_19730 [Chthoniobacter sp.]
MKLAVPPEPEAPPPASAPVPAPAQSDRAYWIIAALILITGFFLRIVPWAGFTGTGFDEALYRDNVIRLDKAGLFNYPLICQLYIDDQRKPDVITKLPPTRFFYIYASWVWKRMEFGDAPPISPRTEHFAQRDPALVSLHRVASLFSCLGLIASGLAAWRILGLRAMPAVLALMAFSPLQIHLSQHALIDGIFTFWAVLNLWLLWENLQRPNSRGFLAAFALGLAAMVITKENSFFVYIALCGLLVANRWARFGHVTKNLLIVGVAGPLLGLITLVLLAGGPQQFSEIYHLLVSKAETLTYAIKTGDGPWYRYLVDLMLISPLVLVLAIGGVFSQVRGHRAYVYLVAFVGFSYAIMCNIRYGMNLRYASIWDLPLRALASAQVSAIATRFGKWQSVIVAVTITALCAYDLRQYSLFFVDGSLYELVTGGLLQAVKILK